MPACRAYNHVLLTTQTSLYICDYGLGSREIDNRINIGKALGNQRTTSGVISSSEHAYMMAPVACYLCHQRSGFATSENKKFHANTSESRSAKNVRCNRWITFGTSSSSITKVKLISDAPCEIMRIFTSSSSPNTRAAIPGRSRKFSPTRQMMAFRPSYFTSASLARSADSAGMPSLVSTVTDTLTSDVETTSTAMPCLSNASKMDFKNPCTNSRRGAATSTIVMRFLTAMALKMFREWGARAVIFVPSQLGLREFST